MGAWGRTPSYSQGYRQPSYGGMSMGGMGGYGMPSYGGGMSYGGMGYGGQSQGMNAIYGYPSSPQPSYGMSYGGGTGMSPLYGYPSGQAGAGDPYGMGGGMGMWRPQPMQQPMQQPMVSDGLMRAGGGQVGTQRDPMMQTGGGMNGMANPQFLQSLLMFMGAKPVQQAQDPNAPIQGQVRLADGSYISQAY